MTDPLLERLSAPTESGSPVDLLPRVVDRWLRAPGPLGEVEVVVGVDGVRYLRPSDASGSVREEYRRRYGRPVVAAGEGDVPAGLLPALRDGSRRRPPVDLSACSDFERAVLTVTAGIPAGELRPYGWVAREAGRPAAVRAVGTVLARNPVPLLVPCHRVSRGDGTLGQYMFGTTAKASLLAAEGADVAGLAAHAGAGTVLVGSDTTGIVCLPSCRHARRITAAHREGFRSARAAAAAGYRGCRVCRPF